MRVKLFFIGVICTLLMGCGEQDPLSESAASESEELSTENAEGTEVEDPYLPRIEQLQAEIEALGEEFEQKRETLSREEIGEFADRRRELGRELRELINERRKFLIREYGDEIPPDALERALQESFDGLETMREQNQPKP